MTILNIPTLSTNVYHDGTPILPGDVAVPVLLVVDANNKITMVRGSPITIQDVEAPVIAGVSTAQASTGYSFAPADGTVADFTSGDVKVYHVLLLSGQPAMTAAQLATLVAASAQGDFGEATLSPNVPGQQVLLSELGDLATSRVYAGVGSGFRAVREGDTVVSYVLAADDSQLKSAAATPPLAVDDRTPPSGLDQVTLGAPAATTIPVQNLDKIVDGGDGVQSLSLFYGTSSDIASAAPVPDNPITPTASYNIAGLDDATVYNVWVAATDGKNAAAPVALGSARTLDATDPVISAFDVAQGEGYTFTATAGTVVDNAAGPLMAYLVMCASPQTTEQLEAIDKAAVNTESKNEAVLYAANTAASVSAMSLSTSEFWNGTAFASISESAPAAPHQLWAHLLVLDAAGNAGSSQNAGAIKTVADRTAPVISSFAVQQSGVPSSVAAENKHEFIAARPDTLDPRITFTRASVATRVNSSGLIETVSADTARFDHDPVTLERRGLLVEEARTNLISDFSSWTASNVTRAMDIPSPMGTSTAVNLVATNVANFHYSRSDFNWLAKTYTFSFFAKPNGESFAYCRLFIPTDPNQLYVSIDLNTGNTQLPQSTIWPVASPQVISFQNGWKRYAITFTVTVGGSGFIDVAGSPTYPYSTSYSGDNVKGVIVWGAQLEEGAFATSYIPTTTAAVTRAGDFPLISGTNLSSWYNATEGTFGVQFKTMFVTDTITRSILSGNSDNSMIHINANTGRVTSFDGGGSSLFTGTSTSGNLSKVYVGYSSGSRVMSVNGRTSVNLNTSRIPLTYGVMNTLHLGYLDVDRVPFCGWIKSLVYYPKRFPAADISALSADDYAFSVSPTTTISPSLVDALTGATFSASSTNSTNEHVSKAFDSDPATYWHSGSAASPCWIQATLASPARVVEYTFINRIPGGASPSVNVTQANQRAIRSWILYGSSDGTNFVVVDNRNSSTIVGGPNIYNVANPGTYNHYRFEIISLAIDSLLVAAVASLTLNKISDGRAGPLKAYLALASGAPMDAAALNTFVAARKVDADFGTARNEAIAYTTLGTAIASPYLFTDQFWDANANKWSRITETAPALNAHLAVYDLVNNFKSATVANVPIADKTTPIISGFAVAQGASDYTFTVASATRVADAKAGNLKVYLVLASSASLNNAQLAATFAALPGPAKQETFTDAMRAAAPDLRLSVFWNGFDFVAISESAPASPHSLTAYLVAQDAAGITTSYAATFTVADRTAPTTPAFSRASIATRVNEAGLIETVAADVPRIDYDPVTLAQKGLLIEESRTNIITSSTAITADNWTINRSTVTASTDFPLFANSGGVVLLTGDGINGWHTVQKPPHSASSSIISMSVYLRRGTNNFAQMHMNSTVFANFDLLNGVVGSIGEGTVTAKIIPWRDGWYRCTLTTTVTAGYVAIQLVTSATATRAQSNNLTTSIYVAGPQLEEGSLATSYIPTDANPVTRAADITFGVTQSTSDYKFSATSGTISDGRPGPLKAYLVLTSQAYTASHIATAVLTPANVAAMEASEKKESIEYPTGGQSLAISGLGMSSTRFWNGTAWAATSEAVTSLFASLVVYDAAGLSTVVGNTRFAVKDVAPPIISAFSVAKSSVGNTIDFTSGTVTDSATGSLKIYHVAALASLPNLSATELAAAITAAGRAPKGVSATAPDDGEIVQYTNYSNVRSSRNIYLHDNYGATTQPFSIAQVANTTATISNVTYTAAISRTGQHNEGVGAVFNRILTKNGPRMSDTYTVNTNAGQLNTLKPFKQLPTGTQPTPTNMGSISGEWVQITSSVSAAYTRYGFATGFSTVENYGKWTVVGSNDGGATFTVLDSRQLSTAPTNTVGMYPEYPMSTAVGEFKTYRFILEAIIGLSQGTAWFYNVWFGSTPNFGEALVSPYTSGASVTLSSQSLLTNRLFAGSGIFRPIVGGESVHSYVLAEDAAGNRALAKTAIATVTPDVTDPTITNFAVTQGTGADKYTFTTSDTTTRVTDNRPGNLKVYFVLSNKPDMVESQITLTVIDQSELPSSAKQEAFTDAMRLIAPNLSLNKYYDWLGEQWTDIDSTSPTTLSAYLVVYDGATPSNIVSLKTVTDVPIADRTAPSIATFGAKQSTSGYSFSLDPATSISDNRNGPLKVYFFLSSADIVDTGGFVTSNTDNVTSEVSFVYSAASGAVTPPALTASKFWNGMAWTDVVETTLSLTAFLVVIDAAGLASSAGVAKMVTDVTIPAFDTFSSSTVTATTVQLSWTGVTDNHDGTPDLIIGAYTAASEITAANLEAGTGTGFVSKVTIMDATGTTTTSYTTGLTGSSSYHFYAVAKDATGNYSDVKSLGPLLTTDVTIPTFDTFSSSTVTATTVQLSWPGVTDNRDGTPDLIIGAYTAASEITAANLEAGTGTGFVSKVTILDATGTTTTSYTTGLTGSSSYHFYAVAKDATGNYSAVKSLGPLLTTDVTAPTISDFVVTPGTENYTFTTSGTTTRVSDNRDGNLKVYFVIADTAGIVASQMPTVLADTGMPDSAKLPEFTAVMRSSAPNLSLSKYYKWSDRFQATAWNDITSYSPSTLSAYIVAYDGATPANIASLKMATALVIADQTAPVITSFAVQQSGVPSSVATETKHEFIADRPDTLDPRITFTRASVATRVNSSGLIETVPANTPRFDHDPVTLARKGLLVEEARTNIINTRLQNWYRFGTASLTNSTARSPDGSLEANTLALSNNSSGIFYTLPSTPGPYTFSVYIRSNTSASIRVVIHGSLVIEEARNQLFNVTPGFEGVTVENGSAVSPAGTMDAFKIIATTSSSFHALAYQKVISAGTYTFSAFVKAAGETSVMMHRVNSAQIVVNLTDGSFTLGSGASGAVQNYGNGWYRCSLTFLFPAENTKVSIWPRVRSIYAGNGVSGVHVWGVQFEAGSTTSLSESSVNTFAVTPQWQRFSVTKTTSPSSTTVVPQLDIADTGLVNAQFDVWGPQVEAGAFATSYIPTTTAAVTRAGDLPLISGANLSSWYNGTEGTFGIQIETMYSVSDTFRHFLSANNNQIFYMQPTTGIVTSFDGQASLFSSASVPGQVSRVFLGYSSTGRSLAARGMTANFSSTFANFTSLTALHIGYLGSSGVQFCGWVKSLVYYPKRFPAADIAALSADDYAFSVPLTTTITDGRAGPLKTYMVLASGAAMNTAVIGSFITARKEDALFSTARKESLTYTTPGTALASPYLFTDHFWDATLATPAWSRISETAPALTAHLAVYDLANNLQTSTQSNVPIADKNPPIISGFAVAQGASDYIFTVASATRVADAKAGNLKVYLVLASSASLDNAQLAATFAALPGPAKQEAFTDAMRAAAPALSSSVFWNGFDFVAISESAPASPHSLTAYLVAQDAAGMRTSCAISRTVADRTAPSGGTVTVLEATVNGFTASWSGFTDSFGVTNFEVYTNTTNAFAGATKFGDDLGSTASSVVITGLASSSNYYAIVRAKDDAGNVSSPIISQIIATSSSTLSSTHENFINFGEGLYIRTGNNITDWVAQGIPQARTPISMYIGTTKILHVDAKVGNGFPDALLTANKDIVVNGTTYAIGSVIRNEAQFGDALNVFAVARRLPGAINPGDYVPSQFATVNLFAASSLFYQSNVLTIGGSGGTQGVVTTTGVPTTGFFNLVGGLNQALIQNRPAPAGSFRLVSCEFSATNTTSGNNRDFGVYMGNLALSAPFEGGSHLLLYVNGSQTNLNIPLSAATNLYKYELKLVNGTECIATVYDVSNAYSVVVTRTVTIAAPTTNFMSQIFMRNQNGAGTFVFGNIILQ